MHPAIAGWVRRHIIDDDPNDHPEAPQKPEDYPALKLAPVYLTPLARAAIDKAPLATEYEQAMAEHRERQDKLERDAARYRWLRVGRKGTYNKILIYAESSLDRAIDEAMAADSPPDTAPEGKKL